MSAPEAEPVRRTFEIEDPTNLYFIHPISAWLVPRFARAGITPNTVSLFGLGCGLLAGLFYHFYRHIGCDIAGFALMLAWHVMDGADGQLARLTQSFSEFGKLLDGICDYVTFTAVYVGLGFAISVQHGGWIWVLIAVSGLCHALQSGAYELQRQNYNFWGLGRQSAAPVAPGGGRLSRAYARMQLAAAGDAPAFHAEFAALLAAHPGARPALREAYRAQFAPVIRRWGVLCANYRTLGIFLAAVLQHPLLYFWFEIIGFSLILLLLLQADRPRNAAFLQAVSQPLVPAFQ